MIDAALARRLVDRQFPQWSGLPIEPMELDGWDNRSFRLGTELTIRLPSGDWYAEQVDKEQRWLPALAPQLPLPIPAPVARGEPDAGYPYAWSVYRWLDGEPAEAARPSDLDSFATAVAGFLVALRGIDAEDGPAAGEHNFFRGGPLAVYDAETREALEALGDRLDTVAAMQVWETALASQWDRPPVWVHGDVRLGNLLVDDGRLCAVIDFGSSGVGDPACDLVLAWTLLSGSSRAAFRRTVTADDTWARARGWALWKSLITLAALPGGEARTRPAARTLAEVLADPC